MMGKKSVVHSFSPSVRGERECGVHVHILKGEKGVVHCKVEKNSREEHSSQGSLTIVIV